MQEIEKFDRRFSKTGVRNFKYPNIELHRIAKIKSIKISEAVNF